MQYHHFRKLLSVPFLLLIVFSLACRHTDRREQSVIGKLRGGFLNPPDSARPGVYWYFMDGNISREGMTADLESMKKAGIGNLVFLEVNVGIPRGKVDFLSEEWQDLFTHAVREAERLGIVITLGVGPGWTGSGGPWVSGEQSMKHLVSTTTRVKGPQNKTIMLPKPLPKRPYFGEETFTAELRTRWEEYYEDVSVLAFPTPSAACTIEDIDEKALYYRPPYTSTPGVKPYYPTYANYPATPAGCAIMKDEIVDVTRFLAPDGRLEWKIPQGDWTIMRFGARNNGAVTRPAPLPGVGFEADKFDTTAIRAHLNNFTGKLLSKIGSPNHESQGGLKVLHMDSWEMGAQNWSANFRQEFAKRRGYDPLYFFPAFSGRIVENLEVSERFLWDLRQTAQELVLDNHARYLKLYGRKFNLDFSIEPYDMNPTADLDLGAVADIPMCEFWSVGYGFNSSFSCIEATSIAHVTGRPVVAAEAFTAYQDAWRQYPGSMKNQGDWAFATGINKLVYHTFQHQPLGDELKPGMTMGPYGVHWDRNQTWWPMADAYHRYITRCQYILQQGAPVADILYLTPEGAPQVFLPPATALAGTAELPDRRGYNFDGCSPSQLSQATVADNRIVFPSGASYRLLVLPASRTMTPELLHKVESLVKAGAIVVGSPPHKSPSLKGYPDCDRQVTATATGIWGSLIVPDTISLRTLGEGRIYWGGALSEIALPELYPPYDATAAILGQIGTQEDFTADASIRYTHRSVEGADIYFVSNKTDSATSQLCSFRIDEGTPELWHPLTGEVRALPDFQKHGQRITVQLKFEPHESYFIVFNTKTNRDDRPPLARENFPVATIASRIDGPWNVSFDPKWGGPKEVRFDKLQDWSTHSDEKIRYYSGIATYRKRIDLPASIVSDTSIALYIHVGEVHNMARVRVNGKDMGVVWTYPFEVEVSGTVQPGENEVEIEVANLWPNRLIGDERLPEDDGIKNNKWPDWLLSNQPRPSPRLAFSTYRFFTGDSALIPSGLLGPVQILTKSNKKQ